MGPSGGAGFPPERRLRIRREFLEARAKGRNRHTPNFIVYVRSRAEGPTRLGVTVTRKVGGAVQRNRVKRLVREFFRRHYPLLPASVDISVIAKKGAPRLGYDSVCRELGFLLEHHPVDLKKPWPKRRS